MYFDVQLPQESTLLIHSSTMRLLRSVGGSPDDILQELIENAGPKSTLLFPLFNFEFTKGVPFDIRTSKSRMGALTEAARKWPGAVRTGHPIYSFAAIGKDAEHFAGLDNFSAYGEDSPFAILRKLNGYVGVIDLPDQHSMTFYHHVEEILNVPYRYHKTFTAPYTDAIGKTCEKSYGIFVRNIEQGVLTSVDRMGELLWSKGLYTGSRPKIGCGLRLINANELFDAVEEVIVSGRAAEFLYEIQEAG